MTTGKQKGQRQRRDMSARRRGAAEREKREEEEEEEEVEEEEEGYRYEEVSPAEQRSLADGEEDLEQALQAAREAEESGSKHQTLRHIPEVVEDFLRNFLRRFGLIRTLDCFQAEWHAPGRADARPADFVPDADTHNRLLRNELETVRRETDGFRQAVFTAGETLVRTQRERDFHRLQHRRVAQDKNRLIQDFRRLKELSASRGPAARQLEEKHQAALRHKMLLSLERDRVRVHLAAAADPGATQEKQHETDGSVTQSHRADEPAGHTADKHPKDSEFPLAPHLAPHLARVTESRSPAPFSLSSSIQAHDLPISCLDLHPHKLILASASEDRLWRLWALPGTGEKLLTGEGHTDWLSGCSFHPDGGRLATTSGDTTVRLWDFTHGCCVSTLAGHSQASWGCSFHSGGDFLASCSADRTARLWDLNSERCRLVLRRHAAAVNSVCFLPRSGLLLTCSADKTLRLWDARLGLCAQTLRGHRHPCAHAAVDPSGRSVASCDARGVVKLWDVRKASAAVTVDTGPASGNQVAFSPSGKTLAVAGSDGLVKLVEPVSLTVTCLSGHSGAVQSVRFTQRGEALLSGGADGRLLLWS
ncbi:sperm-associated antigen 16 protein-like [Centroberyx affinis]|uniref:sperm-associated antigen 16 protein-like n=1 Tax=Centroberyx affinis TaxID=166261 RepID=UPI003A5C2AC1